MAEASCEDAESGRGSRGAEHASGRLHLGDLAEDDAFGGALRLILVEPQDGRNVGSVARLCANFGIGDVVIVSQGQVAAQQRRRGRGGAVEDAVEDVDAVDIFDSTEAAVSREAEDRVAVSGSESPAATDDGVGKPEDTLEVYPFDLSYWKRHAKALATDDGMKVLERVRVVRDFKHALAGCTVAVAFTGRVGGNFRPPRVENRDLGALLPPLLQCRQAPGRRSARLALVFGREDRGLQQQEIRLCSHCCTLPTHGCSSLNLSHAVCAALSRLYEDRQAVVAPQLSEGGTTTAHPQAEASGACGSSLPDASPGPPSGPQAEAPGASGLPSSAAAPGADEGPALTCEVDAFMERLRELLETRGYPVGRVHNTRRNKFCFRIMKHLAALLRLLHRAQVRSSELDSTMRLLRLVGGEDPRKTPREPPGEGAAAPHGELHEQESCGNTPGDGAEGPPACAHEPGPSACPPG